MSKEVKEAEVKEEVKEVVEAPVKEEVTEVVQEKLVKRSVPTGPKEGPAAPYKPSFEVPAKRVGTNPLALPFPPDPQGMTSKLKSGGLIAAKRVGGNKAKLEMLRETLGIIYKHAEARYEYDVAKREESRVNAANARARRAERTAAAAEAKAKEYEAAAARVRDEGGVKPEIKDAGE